MVVPTVQFEKVENKAAVVGYIAAAVSALIFTEWLIHLPALDIVRTRTGPIVSLPDCCVAA